MTGLDKLGIVATLVIFFSCRVCCAQQCPLAEQAYQTGSLALTSTNAGALLLLGDPSPQGNLINVRNSRAVSLFLDGCWSLDRKMRRGLIWFAINNNSPGDDTGVKYLALQILKIGKRQPEEPSAVVVTANCAEVRPWFRGTIATKYGSDAKTVANDMATWNAAHGEYTQVEQNDRVLQGRWHASLVQKGESTWAKKSWWKVNIPLHDEYQVLLENRLMSFELATDVASGIFFPVTPGKYDLFIIRYKSQTMAINHVVRFCFDLCDVINHIAIDDP